MRHPVAATLSSLGAPWVVPLVGLGLFLHQHFVKDSSSSCDARVKAAARCSRTPRLQRRIRRQPSPDVDASEQHDFDPAEQERQLADAVLGIGDASYEWYAEDEVEALQQAQANPQALLSLLKMYGSRMVAEQQLDEETEDAHEDSLWYASNADQHSWHPDTPSSSNSQHQRSQEQQWSQQQQQQQQREQRTGAADQEQQRPEQEQQAGQELLLRLAAAVQRQQQQEDAGSQDSSHAEGEGDYFDDSYFGMPADTSAEPQDLQELQAVVSRNLQALLPKDTTWAAGSYPPRFNEVLSPVGPGLDPGPGLDGPDPEFDLDGLDPGFDYVPDFDFDYEPDFDFDPEGEPDFVFMDELYDFDVEE